MAGIDLTGRDPWPSIGNVPDITGPSAVLGAVGGDWLGIGLKMLGMFGGDSSMSGTGGASGAQINTSGWAIGEDSVAQGGTLAQSSGFSLPWWVWIGGAAIAILAIRGKK